MPHLVRPLRTLVALLVTVAAVATAGAQQFVQLPDNHFLSKSQTQNQANGSTAYWGPATATGRRFQVLYDGSHFTGVHGIAGAITIRHLRFRGEDSEHNRGGQVFSGVVVRVYATALASAAPLSTTFANNVPPAAPNATLLATLTLPALTASASIGRSPNNDILDLDFTAAAVQPFDPTGAQPNLLVDVAYAAASAASDPQGTTMVAIQDTAGTAAFVRGRAVFTAVSVAAPIGSASAALPTMRVEYAGAGAFASLVPARTERFGAACGGAASAFYQVFASHQYFDLKDPGQVDNLAGLRLVPDQYPAPNTYTVSGGAAPVDLVHGLGASPLSQGDDVTLPFALPPGTAFDYPGAPAGGTTVIRPSTNGYVVLDPSSTETLADFSPTVAEFLGSGATDLARLCPFWHDFSADKNATPPFGNPQSGLHAVNDLASNEVLVTWYEVGRFNSVPQVFQESHTMQVSLNWATGVVEFRYGPMDEIWADTAGGQVSGIVGFTRGRIGATTPSVDPQSRDLSIERPFTTQVEGLAGNMGLTAVSAPVAAGPIYQARAFPGQSLSWNVSNVPAGALIGALLLDLAPSRPGLQLPGITTPRCVLSTSTAPLLFELDPLPPSAVSGTATLSLPGGCQPLLLGATLAAQYVTLDGIVTGQDLVSAASNAILHTFGNQ
jgi:hypothetical protein